MKKKEAREAAHKIIDWWAGWMGLKYWQINVCYVDCLHQDNVEALCDAKWEYQQATITVSVQHLKTMSHEEMERMIVHELLHCLVNEMREEGIKHEERVVTSLTSAFIWVRDAAKKKVNIDHTP